MRYFATQTPRFPLHCGGGQTIRWPNFGDGIEGMVPVNPLARGGPVVIACLERCIAEGTGGGIREVTAAEYEEWQKKTQGQPTWKPRPDEFSGGGPIRDSVAASVRKSSPAPAAVPAATEPPPAPVAPPPAPAPAPAAPVSQTVQQQRIPTRRGSNPPPPKS